ncbi:metallophosphoesterase [Bacillus mesophilum]|uniref:Metallophosphoesterase n=1 Tax=Bacillus mesophilum TaxID=1071718 RepID=A0A7V7UW95_9BACI|nr:metallophosphoesterase [Bacillus mesophilum]KAB2333714.1 metallophosphoesterase [Bacillus mesophilum]
MIYFIVLFVLLMIFLLLYMVKEAFANRILHQELVFDDFPIGFGEVKIFFISDIHKRKIHEDIINEASASKPDMVIIGGDLLEKKVPLSRVKENLQKLKSAAPVYFIWGNNDYEVDVKKLNALLIECGVKILDNCAVTFKSAFNESYALLGINDISLKKDRLDLAIKDAVDADFRILVSHEPRVMSKLKNDHRISLVLSGHTHGGQIHFLGFGLYEKGKIKKADTATILISNGYGTTALPLRLGAKAETHLLTIKNSNL